MRAPVRRKSVSRAEVVKDRRGQCTHLVSNACGHTTVNSCSLQSAGGVSWQQCTAEWQRSWSPTVAQPLQQQPFTNDGRDPITFIYPGGRRAPLLSSPASTSAQRGEGGRLRARGEGEPAEAAGRATPPQTPRADRQASAGFRASARNIPVVLLAGCRPDQGASGELARARRERDPSGSARPTSPARHQIRWVTRRANG